MSDGEDTDTAGSVADILGTVPTDATGGVGNVGGSEGGSGDGVAAEGAGGDQGGQEPDWYASLSAEADGDNPSHRDYVKGKNFKTIDDMAKSYREAEKALRDSGRVKIPGADAKPEEVAEFRKLLGVPDDAKGYAMPEITNADGNPVPLNDTLLAGVFEDAHAEGMSKAPMDNLAAKFVQRQLDMVADQDSQLQAAADAVVKSWGNQATEKLAAVDRAASALGLSRNEMLGMRSALGSEKLLLMMARLGEGMAEDVMITGGKGRFGVSGVEAQAEMNRLKTNPDFYAKAIQPGTPENARWNRLQSAVADYADAQAKAT
jgi:hypothetical protein